MRGRRYSSEVVETVNGFAIEREKIGAQVWWHAVRTNEDDFVTASYRNLGYKRDAVEAAKNHKD